MPDLNPDLPESWSTLVKNGPNAVYSGLGQLMDPYCVAAPSVPRNPQVSYGDWLISRIGFCTRDGVANDPEMLLALYSVCNLYDLHFG